MSADAEEPQVGEFVQSIPRQRALAFKHLRVDKYGLDPMAEKARERPGVPIKAGEDIPFPYTNALRTRRRYPYIDDDGRIKISIKFTTPPDKPRSERLVDVYFTFERFPDINY